jgi:two-component system sensor histidine kinase UhpB
LRGLVDDFADHRSMEVRFEGPHSLPPLPEDAEVALFRALQEALSNVARHAGANRVEVKLGIEGNAVVLVVSDDGRGMMQGVERAGSGLDGMRERVTLLGGTVAVTNRPTGGLDLRVRLPIDGKGPVEQASPTRGAADDHGRDG